LDRRMSRTVVRRASILYLTLPGPVRAARPRVHHAARGRRKSSLLPGREL